MNMNKRIAKFLITLTSFTMMTSVNAYQGSDCCNPCANYDPCCPSPARSFYGEVDYIYWGVQEDGLRFAQAGFGPGCCEETSSCDSCGNNCGTKSGCSRNHDISWNSGFKVGAGFANPCCDWEAFVQYTWYRAHPKKCGPVACGTRFEDAPAGFDPAILNAITGVNSEWHFQFNNIDALVTNEFCVNNCFSFRPSFGLKAAWIKQTQNIGVVIDAVLPGAPTGGSRCNQQKFWGIGPKFAVTANASLFDSFSLYGNLGLSTLWTHYKINRNDVVFNASLENDRTSLVCASDCRHPVQSVLETSLGVRWDTDLCCGDYGFYVDIAWEQQVWYNHNYFINSVVNQNHGDLTLQGLTVGAGFSF
jgi:hypothetical protein